MSFSLDYFSARERFRKAVGQLEWHGESHPIPARGPRGQELTVDVAFSPNEDAGKTLLITSGLHGVEGFFGSAVQCALLEHKSLLQCLRNVRLVLIHALNPYGFAWIRRCDDQQVDPNRNFLRQGERYEGCHPVYRRLESWLNPHPALSRWHAAPFKLMWEALRSGISSLREAIAGGQYDYPRGLFYGGSGPSATLRLLRENLGRWLHGAGKVLHLDFHTGLGRWATWKFLADAQFGKGQAAWLERCFGPRAIIRETDATPLAYRTRGSLGRWCSARFSETDYTYLCAEFGTYSPLEVIAGLRAENQAHHWGQPAALSTLAAKRQLKELFCPTSRAWRRRTLRQALALLRRAGEGLEVAD